MITTRQASPTGFSRTIASSFGAHVGTRGHNLLRAFAAFAGVSASRKNPQRTTFVGRDAVDAGH